MPSANDPGTPPHTPRTPGVPSQPARRRFLKLAAGAAAGVALSPLARRNPAAAALHSVVRGRVLAEDIVVGLEQLAGGQLDGTALSANGIGLAPGRAVGRYVSPVLSASRPFTHIGLHWLGASGEGITFEVRSAPGRGGWSEWQPVLIEEHAPEAAGETFGALLGASEHERVQFRATFAHPSARLRRVMLTLLNAPGRSSEPTSATLSIAEAGGIEKPAVVSRDDWGPVDSGEVTWPPMFVPVKKVVVHHTATSNNYTDAVAEVQAIHHYHAVTLGWGDIGYNALIDRDGNIYEGRFSRDNEVLGTDVVAGHAASHNYGTTGIALLGTFTARGEGGRPGIEVPPAMWNALVSLVTWECARHHLDPEEATAFLRWDGQWNEGPNGQGLANIPGHRDCVATICPGGNVHSRLGELRDSVHNRLEAAGWHGGLSLDSPPSTTRDLSLDEALALLYSWGPATGGYRYLLEGWRRDPDDPMGEGILYLSGYVGDRQRDWHSSDESAASFEGAFDGADDPEPGRYTFHVLAEDELGSSYQRMHILAVTDAKNGNGEDDPNEPDDEDPGEGDPDEGDLTLTATGYKVRGLQKADLAWSGASTSQVDVYRDGVLMSTVANTGAYTDHIDQRGSGSYIYHVCEAGGDVCSTGVAVDF